ncbi:MAG: isocitrate lyase/PEP mutase family protein [Alphaproteobacteria bacterium]|nr:isocitrate lyase/PEP mutase family protein [Alphaproteobacteria bacterium]
MASNGRKKLREIIEAGTFVVAPGVFDMISARIADRMGFNALYMTGYGVTASYLGLPDAGLATFTDMLNRARTIAEGTETPLIADADTGYGGLLNVRHTVRGYEAAGVQGIQIEDQEMPKKCGHTPGRRVVPKEEMVQKIQVAVDARRSRDTLIIARTDARTALGIDEAIERAAAYVEAGADIAFVESPESVEEIRKVGKAIAAPKLANMVPGGRTPVVAASELKAMGFNIAIYPGLGFSVAAEAMRRAYTYLKDTGSSIGMEVPTYGGNGAQTMHELMGFPEVWEFEKRWGLGG